MSLKASEAFCYICRGVLIEPVTVPCSHVFCYTCFDQSMQETSYSCPLCRKRISNWVRTAKKTDRLVNVELWTKIKEQFKDQVHSKLRGEDDGLDEILKKECPAAIKISKPGEVGKEFSKFLYDFKNEEERVKAAEELATRELISKINEEEEHEIEILKEEIKLKTRQDEELARKLQEELNKEEFQEIPTSSHIPITKPFRTMHIRRGPMDQFLKGNADNQRINLMQLSSQEKITIRSTSSDSTDSIQSEMHHFKPIKVVPRTPPKRYPDGKVLEISVTKVKPLKLLKSQKEINSSYSAKSNGIDSKKIHSPYSAFIGKVMMPSKTVEGSDLPRKRLKSSSDELDNGVLKEITLGENGDSNSLGPSDPDSRVSQNDGVKKRRTSPVALGVKQGNIFRKNVPNNYHIPTKLFHLDSIENNLAQDDENSDLPPQFDTEDYLAPKPDVKDKLIEEQRRIEQLILQEKSDRELALKLSQEWSGRYELRKKPKEKQVFVKKKRKRHGSGKVQQSLIGSLIRARNGNKQ